MSEPLVRWRPRWKVLSWQVFLHKWQVDILNHTAKTTGEIIKLTPPRWLWIKALLWMLGSRFESVRVFAGTRYYAMRALYWNALNSRDDNAKKLPPFIKTR